MMKPITLHANLKSSLKNLIFSSKQANIYGPPTVCWAMNCLCVEKHSHRKERAPSKDESTLRRKRLNGVLGTTQSKNARVSRKSWYCQHYRGLFCLHSWGHTPSGVELSPGHQQPPFVVQVLIFHGKIKCSSLLETPTRPWRFKELLCRRPGRVQTKPCPEKLPRLPMQPVCSSRVKKTCQVGVGRGRHKAKVKRMNKSGSNGFNDATGALISCCTEEFGYKYTSRTLLIPVWATQMFTDLASGLFSLTLYQNTTLYTWDIYNKM